MKILKLSASDLNGGAARASYRLFSALRKASVDSRMLVQTKKSDNKYIYGPVSNFEKLKNLIKFGIDSLPLALYYKRLTSIFSLQWTPDPFQKLPKRFNPDIIHLNWICDGFIRIEKLTEINVPIVWTLHDMWPFTGGCHYAGDCEKYKNNCGNCPQLSSKYNTDFSRRVWNRKKKNWNNIDLTIITPSNWLADCARKSSLFTGIPIKVIPYALDLELFRPIEKIKARKLLGLPLDKKLILFGAIFATSDNRKGFQFLQPALKTLTDKLDSSTVELIVFGSSEPVSPPDFGLKVQYLGQFYDDISLAILYSAVDVFTAPSTEDNLPNTVIESLGCGTPCVAFNIGGMPDMIEHQKNGYLAKPFDINDLADGLFWVLENPERLKNLSEAARNKAENSYSSKLIAQKHIELYKEILG